MKLLVIGVSETGFGKAGYRFVSVVNALNDTWTLKVLDGSSPKFLAHGVCEDHFRFSRLWHPILTIFVYVTVGVSSDVNGFLPRSDSWQNIVD